ncbi:MAG: transglutaminaseTgpA domain-containing protein, partial [Phycisphaerales bacterium]
MNVAVAFRRMVLVTCLCSIAAFAASEQMGWFLVAAGIAAVAGTALADGPRARSIPPWSVRALILAAIGWGAFDFLSRPEAEEAARVVGTVVTVAMLAKLWERKSAADWRGIIALAIVLLVSAALGTSDFLVGILVIVGVAVLVPTAMLYQVVAGTERSASERRQAAPAGSPAPAAESPQGSHAARSLRRLATVGILLGLSLSVGAFAVFPREIGVAGRSGARVSGFRAGIQLWSAGRISQSSRVAMTVRLLDPRDAPAELVMPLRMRGAVLERYDPGEARWREAADRSRWRTYRIAPGAGFEPFSPIVSEERSNVWTQDVQMRSLASDRIFSAWMPLSISGNEERSVALDPRTGELTDLGTGSGGRPQAYRIRMQAFPSPRFVEAVLPNSAPRPGRTVSFPVPRVREIAERILGESELVDLPTEDEMREDPELRRVRARRIAAYFEAFLSSPRFRYTTDLSDFRRIGDEDPIALFLERYRFGHCELFASAMVALCRSVGIDARVVTGVLSTEYDGISDRYVFRESGAHAWVEVRTGDWQWMTFDPSPIEELLAIQQANRTWLDGFRWILDPIEFAWNSRFAGFDSRAQADLAERLGEGSRRARDRAAAMLESIERTFTAWFMPGAVGF